MRYQSQYPQEIASSEGGWKLLWVQGTAAVCITLAGKKFTTKVTIIDDISAEAILEMGFLAAEDCCLDLELRVLSIWSQELQLELCSKTKPEHGMSQMPVTCDHH